MSTDFSPKQNFTRRIAWGGMLIALGWLMNIISTFLPTGRLFVLAIASLAVVIAWLELGRLDTFMVYLGICLLTLIWPGVLQAAVFALFFGLCPLLMLNFDSWMPRKWAVICVHSIFTILFFGALVVVGIEALLPRTYGLTGAVLYLALAVLVQLVLFFYSHVLKLLTEYWVQRIRPYH